VRIKKLGLSESSGLKLLSYPLFKLKVS
jgi:hypothetical protein